MMSEAFEVYRASFYFREGSRLDQKWQFSNRFWDGPISYRSKIKSIRLS
jgi:hypothetical protein